MRPRCAIYTQSLLRPTVTAPIAIPSPLACSSTCPRCSRSLHTSTRRSARIKSHYESLKLPKNATKQQIKSQFYALSKQTHPDAPGGDASKFHEINEAYHVLGDDSARRSYDESLNPAPQTSQGYGQRPPGFGYAQPGYTTQRGSTTGGTYWSGRHRPPPPPGGDYYAYSPFGRHTPPGYGGPSSGSYGAGPRWTNPFEQGGMGGGEGRSWGSAGFGAGMGSAFDSAKQEQDRMQREQDRRGREASTAGRFFLITAPFVVLFALAGQFTVKAEEKGG